MVVAVKEVISRGALVMHNRLEWVLVTSGALGGNVQRRGAECKGNRQNQETSSNLAW